MTCTNTNNATPTPPTAMSSHLITKTYHCQELHSSQQLLQKAKQIKHDNNRNTLNHKIHETTCSANNSEKERFNSKP